MTQIPQSEDDWAATVYDYARMMGWLCFHPRPATNRRGQWSTPLQGDPGYFDWTFLRERFVFAELKVPGRKLSPDQLRWYERAIRYGHEAYVWYPADWPQVKRALARPRTSWHREVRGVDARGRL